MQSVGLNIGKTDLLIQTACNQQNNNRWTVVYVKNGVGLYIIDTSLRCLNEGDMMIIPPHVEYSFRSQDLGDEYNINLDSVVVYFEQSWLDDLIMVFPTMREQVLMLKELRSHYSVHGPKWMKLASLLEELSVCSKSEQPLKVLAVLSLICTEQDMTLIKDFEFSAESDVSEKKERIDRYISCNFTSKISLQDIADYVGVSRSYFSMFFKRHYKEGFSDYLNRMRVERASQMLIKTGMSIPSISAACGFSTVQYFTLAFKKYKGIPPGKYRKE